MDEIITCPKCGNCYKKKNEQYHFFNLCKKDENINYEDLKLATKLINSDLIVNPLKYEDSSTFSLLGQNNIKKSKSNVINYDQSLKESKFCLFDIPSNNNIIENNSSSLIIPEESIYIFHKYLDDLEKSYFNPIDPNIINYLPEITVNKNSYNGIRECTICKNNIQINEKAIILPCTDIFHSKCIKENFKTNNKCPNCNYVLNHENLKESSLSILIKNDKNKNSLNKNLKKL
jgi:hypothetical protein